MEGNQWAAIIRTVIGDLHIRKNLPNQDAILFSELPGGSPAFVMAVSDGHGSEKCPRSNIGSNLAVETAVKVFIGFWNGLETRLDDLKDKGTARVSALMNIERHIRKVITKELVDKWAIAVDSSLAAMPFPTTQDQTNRLLSYGATLTIVFHCDHFSACLRLGDCEVLTVSSDSKVSRITPKDRKQVGEETDSLCMPNAEKLFNVSFHSFDDAVYGSNKLYLICSDGYEKAFESDAGFEQSAIDFAHLVSSGKGREIIEKEIESWLRESSSYSGDDVSVGLLFKKTHSDASDIPCQLNATNEDNDGPAPKQIECKGEPVPTVFVTKQSDHSSP